MKLLLSIICMLISAAVQADDLHEMFYDKKISDAEVTQYLKSLPKNVDKKQALLNARPTSSKKFLVRGKVALFDMQASYGTKHGIVYYIPKTIDLEPNQNHRALVFLHGGGASTATYDDAIQAAITRYIYRYMVFAEKTKTILVFPSSSIGWNSPTRFFIRELLDLMREDLALDPNNIVVSGHSMGGMGITREGNWFADLFSGIEALAAGTPEPYSRRSIIKAYFNVPYTHINGIKDEFDQWDSDMKKVCEKIEVLETKFKMKSKFKYITHPGDHQPQMPLSLSELEKLYENKRDLYQKDLFGTFYFSNLTLINSNLHLTFKKIARYFWIEVLANKITKSAGEYASLDAKIEGNKIILKDMSYGANLTKLRINLSDKMVDMKKPIQILWNNTIVFIGIVKPDLAKTVEIARRNHDHAYLFDNYVDITHP